MSTALKALTVVLRLACQPPYMMQAFGHIHRFKTSSKPVVERNGVIHLYKNGEMVIKTIQCGVEGSGREGRVDDEYLL